MQCQFCGNEVEEAPPWGYKPTCNDCWYEKMAEAYPITGEERNEQGGP